MHFNQKLRYGTFASLLIVSACTTVSPPPTSSVENPAHAAVNGTVDSNMEAEPADAQTGVSQIRSDEGVVNGRRPASGAAADPFDIESLEQNFQPPRIPPTEPLRTLSVASFVDSTTSQCPVVGAPKGGTRLERCEIKTEDAPNGARMNVLIQAGTLAENAYAHGYLLAHEIENGSVAEALGNFAKIDQFVPKKLVQPAHALLGCYLGIVKRGVSSEFRTALAEMHRGYAEKILSEGGRPKFTSDELASATYSIEVGNIVNAISYQAKVSAPRALLTVVQDCGMKLAEAELRELVHHLVTHEIVQTKFACSGAVVTAASSADGVLYHARNLEQTAMIESWNRNPVAFLVSEPGYHKYVAFGTAGLIFPGGISGYNDQGISVSTHQMDPVAHGGGRDMPDGSGAVGPYVQQRVLREASSIDGAVRIAQSMHHFAGWTILVSDAKTQEAVSIEITRDGAVVGNRSKPYGLAQSNHFHDPGSERKIFQDSYNFQLETYARYRWIDHVLQAPGKRSFGELLGLMASHVDWFTGDIGYGRSVARVMNIMSTVVSPERKKAWVTLSDRMPSNHGYYLGLDVNFKAMTLAPFEAVRIADLDATPNRKAALTTLYTNSFRKNNAGDAVAARVYAEQALRSSLKDGIDDLNFRMVIAHFLLLEKKYSEAYAHLKVLNLRLSEIHPWERAQVRAFQIFAIDHLGAKSPDFVRDSRIARKMVSPGAFRVSLRTGRAGSVPLLSGNGRRKSRRSGRSKEEVSYLGTDLPTGCETQIADRRHEDARIIAV